jgi:hypothetical protein
MHPAMTCCHAWVSCVNFPSGAAVGCNIRLVEALAQNLPIFFDHVVTGIDYSEASVAVHTAKQPFTGADWHCAHGRHARRWVAHIKLPCTAVRSWRLQHLGDQPRCDSAQTACCAVNDQSHRVIAVQRRQRW